MATQDNCRITPKRMDCGSDLGTQAKPAYPAFSVCLPFGRSLEWDGEGLRLRGTATIADGTYGLVVVEGGCITGAQEQPVCDYTPMPCTPAATPCGDSSGGASLQPGADNLLNYDSAGRLGAQLHYTNGDNITMTGSGTAADPLRITASFTQQSTYVQQGDGPITVQGDGSGNTPYVVSHQAAIAGGSYGGFTVDAYGHITGYTEVSGAITNINNLGGLRLVQSGTIVQVGLENLSSADTYRLGAYDVQVDLYGRVSRVGQAIDLGNAYEIDPKQYTLSINRYGTITALTAKTNAVENSFCVPLDAGRTETAVQITTVETGYLRITYKGLLTGTATTQKGFVPLPSPFRVYVNNRAVQAYARYSTEQAGYVEVMAVTDGYYAAGTHTVEIRNSSGAAFNDVAFLSVDLVSRGNT